MRFCKKKKKTTTDNPLTLIKIKIKIKKNSSEKRDLEEIFYYSLFLVFFVDLFSILLFLWSINFIRLLIF